MWAHVHGGAHVVVHQHCLSFGMSSSVKLVGQLGGSGALFLVGQPHGAVLLQFAESNTRRDTWLLMGRGNDLLMMLRSWRQFLERNMDDSSAMTWRNSVTVMISLPITVTTTGMAPSTVSGCGYPSTVLSLIPYFNSIDLGILSFLSVSSPPHSTVQPVSAIPVMRTSTGLLTTSWLGIGFPRNL